MSAGALRYVIADAEGLARQHPQTFRIPPLVYRERVSPGDTVKLVFAPTRKRGASERMWVRVDSCEADGSYTGTLKSDPIMNLGIGPGDPVRFEPRHVIDLYRSGKEVA